YDSYTNWVSDLVVFEEPLTPVTVIVDYDDGDVTVTVDPPGGATVSILDGDNVEVYSGGSGSTTVDPADSPFTWSASPSSGFIVSGAEEGSFGSTWAQAVFVWDPNHAGRSRDLVSN